MERVTAAQVQELAGSFLDLGDIAPHVTSAHAAVNVHLGAAGLGEDLLAQIELWLAAHLVAVRDPELRISSRKSGDLSTGYAQANGTGLDSTMFGQQVRLLDPTGKMAEVMNPARRPWRFRAGSPPNA